MRRLLIRIFLLGLVPAAALIAGAHYYVAASRYVTTENAYVKAPVVSVSAEIAGRVQQVLVADHRPVKTGEPLFMIDAEPYRIAFRKTEAELRRVRNEIKALRAAYAGAGMELKEAKENIRYYERVFVRQTTLARKGIASRAKFDEAQRNVAVSRQRANALKQRLLSILARMGGRVGLPVEQHPDYLQAKAIRDNARLDLNHTTVYAPASGIVGRVTLQPGEYVKAGQPVFPLVQSQEKWVEANLKETQLTHLKVGQKATIVLDAYPDRKWSATISSISPSTGAEFAVLPPQNASGNWVKVVQRVPVRLAIEDEGASMPLRAGMTARVRIDTERDTSLIELIGSALAWTSGRQ